METILEHLLSSERKTSNLVKVLKALKLRIKFTSDGRWFHILENSNGRQ